MSAARTNAALPRMGYTASTRAKLMPMHFTEHDTREAQRAVAEVLSGRGRLLGTGNFGVVYAVAVDATPLIVKLATKETIHSRHWQRMEPKYRTGTRPSYARGRSRASSREEIVHEAGIANSLWSRGVRCVPATVFAQHKNVYALVREYGELVDGAALSLDEYDGLAYCLSEIVNTLGVAVHDDLLVARRVSASADRTAPRGSLFIADVGFWSVITGKRTGWSFSDPYEHALSDLWGLLHRVKPVASLAEIEHARSELRSREAAFETAIREREGGSRMYAENVRSQKHRIETMIAARAKMQR